MELVSFSVTRLFGVFDHSIAFKRAPSGVPSASLSILFGENGVGKTTILGMLDGILRKERASAYDIFRDVPFASCSLELSSGDRLRLDRVDGPDGEPVLRQSFGDKVARLGGTRRSRAAVSPADTLRAREITAGWAAATSELSFEFIRTGRIDRRLLDVGLLDRESAARQALQRELRATSREAAPLAQRITDFLTSAQLDYGRFFERSAPELFPLIIANIESLAGVPHDAAKLVGRLASIRADDESRRRLGIEADNWNFDELVRVINGAAEKKNQTGLAVAAQYVDVLESRSHERGLLADRVFTLERVVNSFFKGKQIRVGASAGLTIETESGAALEEWQLSSGEYHLLYLLVAATIAKRSGTILAIDEPELSMHIAWQSRLISALFECSANSQPQFVLATHSPDLAAEYSSAMIELRSGSST